MAKPDSQWRMDSLVEAMVVASKDSNAATKSATLSPKWRDPVQGYVYPKTVHYHIFVSTAAAPQLIVDLGSYAAAEK